MSRIAVLELNSLTPGARMMADPPELSRLGELLRGRLQQQWARFPSTLELFRDALARHGHDSRGADQFGTLLACGELLLGDGTISTQDIESIAECFTADDLTAGMDNMSDEKAMLDKLLSTVIDPFRQGTRMIVCQWIERAAGLEATIDEEASNHTLGTYGLRVHRENGRSFLAMANSHSELSKIFDNSKWGGRNGRGGWRQSALRLDGAQASKNPIRFSGHQSRCVLIPLELITGKKVQEETNAVRPDPDSERHQDVE